MKVMIAESQKQRQDCLDVRMNVFVKEQKVPADLEIDELEDECVHFILYQDDGTPAGTGRYREVDGYGKAERICVMSDVRQKGSGRMIMSAIEDYARSRSIPKVKLHAQVQAIPFYERLGYQVISDVFMDAGIPHRTMEKELQPS